MNWSLRGDHWTINHKSFFLTLIVYHTFLSYGHRAGGNLTVSKSSVLPNRHRRRLWHCTRGRLNWRSPNAAENETVTTGCKVVTWSCFFTDSIQYFLWILKCQKVYLNETLTPRRFGVPHAGSLSSLLDHSAWNSECQRRGGKTVDKTKNKRDILKHQGIKGWSWSTFLAVLLSESLFNFGEDSMDFRTSMWRVA